MALAWLKQRHRHVIPITGARTAAQLQENLGSVGVTLPEGAMSRLTKVRHPGAGLKVSG